MLRVRKGLGRRRVGRRSGQDRNRLRRIIGVEDDPQAGVGVGGLAGHLGHNGDLLFRGPEDGVQTPGNAGTDAANG